MIDKCLPILLFVVSFYFVARQCLLTYFVNLPGSKNEKSSTSSTPFKMHPLLLVEVAPRWAFESALLCFGQHPEFIKLLRSEHLI